VSVVSLIFNKAFSLLAFQTPEDSIYYIPKGEFLYYSKFFLIFFFLLFWSISHSAYSKFGTIFAHIEH
jgi:hypothetical protein